MFLLPDTAVGLLPWGCFSSFQYVKYFTGVAKLYKPLLNYDAGEQKGKRSTMYLLQQSSKTLTKLSVPQFCPSRLHMTSSTYCNVQKFNEMLFRKYVPS